MTYVAIIIIRFYDLAKYFRGHYWGEETLI